MIEVRRRNHKGNIQFYGWFDRNSFCNTFNISDFSNSDTGCIFVKKWIELPRGNAGRLRGYEIAVREFSYVAYNTKGKLLTTDHLLGIKRQFDQERWKKFCRRYPNHYWCRTVIRSGFKRRHRRYHRSIKTQHERRWVHAWDDEEFAPKIRCRRNVRNLPNSWDDPQRYNNRINNWKRYRNHQWKDKKEGI